MYLDGLKAVYLDGLKVLSTVSYLDESRVLSRGGCSAGLKVLSKVVYSDEKKV